MKKAFSIKKIISILSIGVCILFTIFLNAQTHVYSSFFVKQISLSARFNNSTSYGTAYGLKIGKIIPSGDSISVDTLSPIAAGEIFSVNDSVSVGNKFFLQWKDQYYGTLYYLYEYDLNSNEIIRFDGLPQPYFKGAFLINGVYYYQAHYLYDTATSVIHTYKFDGTN